MEEEPNGSKAPANSRRKFALGVVLIAAAVAVGVGGFYWWYRQSHISTDDAFVDGDIHMVSARIQGKVVEVLVHENEPVKQEQPLLKLDPEPYEVREAVATADLAAATANLNAAGEDLTSAKADLARMRAAVEAARAQVALSEARLAQAEKDSTRATELFQKKVVSRERHEQTQTSRDVARAEADAAREGLRLAEAALPVQDAQIAQREARIKQQRAMVQQRESLLAEAKLNRGYAVVEAPVEGYVTRKNVEVGQIVSPGQPLLAVVPLSDVYVTANYKETQISRIRPGLRVEIEADTYPGKSFSGKVDSIMAGTGSAFSLFPPENATGNYVKIVQRVPVKIVLDKGADPEHVLRIGMSVVPTVFTK